MPRIPRLLILALLVAMATVPAAAEATADAQTWLDKMARVHEQGPFTVQYSATMNMKQMGQEISMTMDGKLTQGGERHQRMEMDGSMNMPGMESGMEMKILTVSDGETMWTEMQHPMMGKQVMKIGIEDAKKLAASGGGGLGGNTGMDPVSQIRQLSEMFDLDVTSKSGGKVTLTAEMTDEAKAKLGQNMPSTDGVARFTLVLDEKTAFPTEMRMGGDDPMMVMNFTGFKRVAKDELGEDVFAYAPPEGVQVMDLGAMVGAGAGP